MTQDHIEAKVWLIEQFRNGISVKDLIKSSMTEICERSTNIAKFLLKLYENGAIPDTVHQEIEARLRQKGEFEAFILIYKHLIKTNNGIALIEAWDANENYYIMNLLYTRQQVQQAEVNERRVSTGQAQTQQQQQQLQNPRSETFFASSAQNLNVPSTSIAARVDSFAPIDDLDFSATRTSSSQSADPDPDVSNVSNYSRDSSDASLMPSSPPAQSTTSTSIKSSHYSKSGRPDNPLPLEKRALIDLGTKTVTFHWVKTKAKYLAQACQKCQATLRRIKIENLTLITPKRSKVRQKFGQVRCNCPNLTEFSISEKTSPQIIRLTTLKSLMFFTPVDFHFDKSPTLCRVMKESVPLKTISYEKGGVTFIHLKKEDRNLKLVLRKLTFLKCEPFLKEVGSDFTALSFSAYGFESLDRSLNFLSNPEQVTELILIKVSFTHGFERLYQFVNLTKLIIHLSYPTDVQNENNCYKMDLCKLLRTAVKLEKLVLRHVTLVGNLSEEDRTGVMKFKSVMLYMCSLKKLEGMLTQEEKEKKVDWRNKLILKWENETGSKNSLVWDILNCLDENLYFYTFQMSDFFKNDVWNSDFSKHFVKLEMNNN